MNFTVEQIKMMFPDAQEGLIYDIKKNALETQTRVQRIEEKIYNLFE